jgi:glycosyltransferase involved in cell wall biosynthesis
MEEPFTKWAFLPSRRRPGALVWTSQTQAAACREAVQERVGPGGQHVVPLGLDLRRFGNALGMREQLRRSWGVDSDTVIIGTASALRERKRVGDYIALVQTLLARHRNVFGVFAGGAVSGEEKYGRQATSQLRDLEKSGRFRWLGNVEPIEPVLQALDIYVSTSDYETFGMAVCEAMACERPVVAYQGGSVQEVLGNGGVVVPDRELAALIDRVDELVRAKGKREELGQRGRRRVAEIYNPSVSFQQLFGIYTALSCPAPSNEVQENE